MSLPAPLSAVLPIALVRRTLGTAVPMVKLWAGLGAVPPGQYRSAFPPRLRAGRIAVLLLALVWLAAGLHAVGGTAGIVRTVGRDTTPSVAAAERIRTGLAAANADFALAVLSGEGTEGAFLSALHGELRAVRGAIVAAAGNVTFGEEERGPIGTVLQGLGDYEQLVGRALASQGALRNDMAVQADDLLHWTALPAAATLERVNADHLAEDDASFLGSHALRWWITAAMVLTAALVAVQVDMARTARRLLNPELVLATVLVAAATVLVTARVGAARSDLRAAKSDAFDSVYALSTIGALAADAGAAQSFFVLTPDRDRAKAYEDAFASRAARLSTGDGPSTLRAAAADWHVPGYFGDELANITFPGEREAATRMVLAWDAVRASDAVFHAGPAYDAAVAQASVTVDRPGSARRAFLQFDAALAKVLAINRDAFARSIAAAEGDTGPLVPVLLAAAVASVAAAWLGIRRRLDDYRF